MFQSLYDDAANASHNDHNNDDYDDDVAVFHISNLFIYYSYFVKLFI